MIGDKYLSIRLSGLVDDSTVDGPGIRFVVFTQGCPHNCPCCHNEAAQSFTGGYEREITEIVELIKKNPLLDGVTFSGGEPFAQAFPLSLLAKDIHALGLDIITYTGYIYEDLVGNQDFIPLLRESDFLVDGQYIHELRTEGLVFRGSSNQRFIDVKKSLAENRAVIVLSSADD